MKIKSVIKAAAFILIFFVIFVPVQELLVGESTLKNQWRIGGFFERRDNSLDAVFIGSSTVYAFWSASVAFEKYGITVYPFSSAAQPMAAAKYIIEQARKTQPDALYIVNVTSVQERYDLIIHSLLNYFPMSLTKLKVIDYLGELGDLSFSERMEYVFPIIRYHTRWSKLNAIDYFPDSDSYMGGSFHKSYLRNTYEKGADFVNDFDYEATCEIPDSLNKIITDILDYCEQEQVKVLFYIAPQAMQDEQRILYQNTVSKIITDRGFDIIDLRLHDEEIGLDYVADYYNEDHTNVHGCIKVTDYLSRYLVENYGFEDKREQEGYDDWHSACENYDNLIFDYLSEQEQAFVSGE